MAEPKPKPKTGKARGGSSKAGASKRTGGKADEASSTAKDTSTAKGKATPEPNLQERMEGLQGWMAEIERKQARMTRFGAIAGAVAVAAAAAALYLAVTTKSDSATKDDVDDLQAELDGISQQVTRTTETQVKSLSETVSSFETRVAALEKQQSKTAAEIAALRSQATAPGTTTTPTTPGTTTTTPSGGKKP
jgi:hypothetical protein